MDSHAQMLLIRALCSYMTIMVYAICLYMINAAYVLSVRI